MSHFIDNEDHLFRSHFLRANQLADRAYEHVLPAYRLGQEAATDPFNEGCGFEAIEKDLENGWLNVRVNTSDWASVREFARAGFESARHGRIPNAPPPGESRHLATYSDPLAEGVDPTAPESPEQRY